MQGFRGTCTEQGCHKQRYSQGLCQAHYREAGLVKTSVYPPCAGDGCTSRARGRTAGSLCNTCRRRAGDTSILCETEGCSNIRLKRGLCTVCFNHLNGVTRPARRGQGRKQVQCARPGCKLKRYDHHTLCSKHQHNWNSCIMRGCAQPITDNNKCDKHKPGLAGACSTLRCLSPRFKAGLCYRHYTRLNPPTCARQGCDNHTNVGIYCQVHNVGIDFAAGDWHDWVVVDQLWAGQLDPDRKPTVPELNELFDRADRAGIGFGKYLAEQTGVDYNRLRSWRDVLGRVERQGMEVAA